MTGLKVELDVEAVDSVEVVKSTEITISETTLRKIISDYAYKRPQYKKHMKWKSDFSKIIISIELEEKPFSQESLGYQLQKEL